jgi:hypothetical protein
MATPGATGTEASSQWKRTGYPKLAKQMAESTNLMVFRRFNNLNIFNLLSLQAELVDLEGQLQERWEYDDAMEESFSKNFKSLRETMDPRPQASNDEASGQLDEVPSEDPNEEPNEDPSEERKTQWKLVLKIRDILKEYSTRILF